MHRYLIIENDLVRAVLDLPEPGQYTPTPTQQMIEVFPSDPEYNAQYNDGWGVNGWNPRPSIYHDFNGSLDTWTLNQSLFTPYLEDSLKNYRDSKISVPVSYTNSTPETFTVLNSDGTRQALSNLANALPIGGDDEVLVDFKTEEGFKVMGVDDVQGMFKACVDRQQKCFSAEKVVLQNHATSPYTDTTMAAVYSDFDAEL